MDDDALKLTMLGTGGGFDRCDTGHTNALIETPDETLLVDCSLYALDTLEEMGVDPLDIDGVIVTHIHGDHVSGLEEFGFRHKFLGDEGERPTLYAHPKILPSRWGGTLNHDGTDLWENTLKGGMMHRIGEHGEPVTCNLEEWFEPRVTHDLTVGDGNWRVKFLEVEHVPGKDSFGLLLTPHRQRTEFDASEVGPAVLYTADSRPFDDEGWYEDVDVIFHDCHLLPKDEIGIQTIHTHLDELLELPDHVQSKIHPIHYGEGVDAMDATNGTSLDPVYTGEEFTFRAGEPGVERG